MISRLSIIATICYIVSNLCYAQQNHTADSLHIATSTIRYAIPDSIRSDVGTISYATKNMSVIEVENRTTETYWLFLSTSENASAEEILYDRFWDSQPRDGSGLYQIALDFNSIWTYDLFTTNIKILAPGQRFSIIISPASEPTAETIRHCIRYISRSTLSQSPKPRMRRLTHIDADSPFVYPADCILFSGPLQNY